MKHVVLKIMLMALVGCASTPTLPLDPKNKDHTVIETAIRRTLNKSTGELNKADLDKVKGLYLGGHQISDLSPLASLKELEGLSLQFNRITDLTPLEELSGLKNLWIEGNPGLTIEAIAKLQRALPKCKIIHNAKK